MAQHRLTVTEIAERLCVADGLTLSDHSGAYGRVRNIVRSNFLQGGEIIDARGTLAFPSSELCRARILALLATMDMNLATVGPLIGRAASDARPATWPDRCRVDGGYQWRGLADIVDGVAAGEPWHLRIRQYPPGNHHGQRLTATFVCGDDNDSDLVDQVFGSTPLATLSLNLSRVFAGLDA